MYKRQDVGALGKETIEAILKRPFAGGYYSERIWGNTSKLTEQLYETVLSGLLNGKPLKKMINELTETMGVGESLSLIHISIYDYEEGKEELSLLILRNNYVDGKSDYLIE